MSGAAKTLEKEKTYLEKERILNQALHGLQEEAIESVEITGNRMLSRLNLVENLLG